MPRFSPIEVWPTSGSREGYWGEDEGRSTPALSSFFRSARSPADQLSLVAREAQLALPNSGAFRLFAEETDDEFVAVEVWKPYFEGPEGGRISVPKRFEELSGARRRRSAAAVLLAALRMLADLRGVDRSVMADVEQAFAQKGDVYRAAGPWKSDPSRKMKARLHFALHDDGFGRMAVEIMGGGSSLFASGLIGGTTAESFKRAIGSFRWQANGTLSFSNSAAYRPTDFVVDAHGRFLEGLAVEDSLELVDVDPSSLPTIKSAVRDS